MRDPSNIDELKSEIGGSYARYVLVVLVLVFAISQADRLILSILAEDVKADLGVTDSQIGFLFGTAFGVFYAVFGVSLGRLADFLSRRALLATGMALWSAMTVFSGLSRSFFDLAIARAFIGIGEATVGPASYSILSDRFAKAQRATVLAICVSGLFVGNGMSKFIGGWVLTAWQHAFPHNPPFGIHAWQATFFIMGAPGLLAALWVLSLREPVRGIADGIIAPKEPKPWTRTFVELAAAVPPLTLINAARYGMTSLAINVAAAAILAALAYGLAAAFHDPEQWIALALGVYASFSWAQSLRHRDRATFSLIFATPTYLTCIGCFSLLSFVTWSVGFWAPPYAIRVLHASPALVGSVMGIIAAAGGLLGGVFGGRVADVLLKRNPSGRLFVGFGSTVLLPIFIISMMHTQNVFLYFALYGCYCFFGNMWVGVAAATTQDLVLPHMRGASAAANALAFTLIGLCIGPYVVGKFSVALGDLGLAMELTLVVIPIAFLLLLHAFRTLPAAEGSRIARAESASKSA
ncbi:MAG TPA: MFS transporter [Caulobacterales bacterium]|nr:MFS transporter [Caulobacterales bacterium]